MYIYIYIYTHIYVCCYLFIYLFVDVGRPPRALDGAGAKAAGMRVPAAEGPGRGGGRRRLRGLPWALLGVRLLGCATGTFLALPSQRLSSAAPAPCALPLRPERRPARWALSGAERKGAILASASVGAGTLAAALTAVRRGAGPKGEEGAEDVDSDAEALRRLQERLTREISGSESPDAVRRSVSGLIDEDNPFWAKPDAELGSDGLPQVGSVLLAHPEAYASWQPKEGDDAPWSFVDPDPARLARLPKAMGRTWPYTSPPAPDAPRRERAALPVVLITKRSAKGSEGLMLGFWSGRLFGDLDLSAFQTRPMYFGGPGLDQPLSILHAYPELAGSLRLTEDGLMLSDDFGDAVKWVRDEVGSPLRFKFFIRKVLWAPGEEAELAPEAGVWLPTRCSRDLLLREPDSSFEEPLWSQIAEKAGGEVGGIARAYELLPN